MVDQIKNMVESMIKPLRNRVYNIVSRAVLEAVNDSGNMQLIKISVLANENRGDIEYFQDYGFTSVPKAGAEAIILCPQGNREHMVAIKVGDRTFRLKGLAEGEVAMFTDEGDKIHFKRGNIIDIDCNTLELGRGTLEKILNGETFQTFFNTHVHRGNLGVETGPPTIISGAAELSTVVKGAK